MQFQSTNLYNIEIGDFNGESQKYQRCSIIEVQQCLTQIRKVPFINITEYHRGEKESIKIHG